MKDFTSIETRYYELAELAEAQCKELMEVLETIEDPDSFDDDPERLMGIRREKNGAAALIFQSEDMPHQRTVVFVNHILELADLLRRERDITQEPRT